MAEEELVALQLATTDELTGLSNRRGFLMLARASLAMCKRTQQRAALAFFDIDGLKAMNDKLGHEAGDALIRSFGQLLHSSFRESDLVARLGGDEFVALFPFAPEDLSGVHLRLEQAVERQNIDLPPERHIRYSVGTIVIEPGDTRDLESWIKEADALMYQRKRAQRSA